MNALTLDAFYGKASGSVTLNGVALTDSIFKKHCYVVKQHDKHWPFLTTRETLMFAAELFEVADRKSDLSEIVEGIIHKMGLAICADTRCARLSGGQARRLSIAVALLKQPTVLFLGMCRKTQLKPTQIVCTDFRLVSHLLGILNLFISARRAHIGIGCSGSSQYYARNRSRSER